MSALITSADVRAFIAARVQEHLGYARTNGTRSDKGRAAHTAALYQGALDAIDALETAQRERAEWEANAQRENALLVQAQQRIAALEAEAQDVQRVEAWPASVRKKFQITDVTKAVGTRGVGFYDIETKNYWAGYANAVDDAERAIRAALGRMLKEGENG